jgi:hypothetical protein
MGYKLHLYEFPHSCLHSFHSTQPKDTPLRFLVFTLTTIYNMDSRCCNKRSLSQMHIVILYAPISISSDFCYLHHSSTSTFHIIYPFLEQHVYFAKSLAHWSLAMTSLVVQTDNKKKNSYHHKTYCFAPSLYLLLYLPSSIT